MSSTKSTVVSNFTINKDVAPEKKVYVTFFSTYILAFLIIALAVCIGVFYYLFFWNISNPTIYTELQTICNNTSNINFPNLSQPTKVTQKNFNVTTTAKALGIYELTNGTPIYEKNTDAKLNFASITKLLTVSTVESLFSQDTMFNIDAIGGNTTGSLAYVQVGEKIKFIDALYGMMLPSGNDVAISAAMQYGYENFVKAMNESVKSLDLKSTNITNPVGYDDVGKHYSSARDIFTISRLYLNSPLNRQIAKTSQYTIKGVQKSYPIENTNQLLIIPEVMGLKTGTTDLAGQSLVLLIKIQDREYVVVILGSTDRFKEGEAIVNWLKANG